eukprot:TRINITY_DN2314_c0_g1_i1.p1 TRINITY_DN2314_c0_g1~~TRINITY_DN2314_c0_g1_i1.p1  ORF type:complete len:661 (-),score=72.58 TRINITY_DN2314_c0_g1_i1:36-2018(-)
MVGPALPSAADLFMTQTQQQEWSRREAALDRIFPKWNWSSASVVDFAFLQQVILGLQRQKHPVAQQIVELWADEISGAAETREIIANGLDRRAFASFWLHLLQSFTAAQFDSFINLTTDVVLEVTELICTTRRQRVLWQLFSRWDFNNNGLLEFDEIEVVFNQWKDAPPVEFESVLSKTALTLRQFQQFISRDLLKDRADEPTFFRVVNALLSRVEQLRSATSETQRCPSPSALQRAARPSSPIYRREGGPAFPAVGDIPELKGRMSSEEEERRRRFESRPHEAAEAITPSHALRASLSSPAKAGLLQSAHFGQAPVPAPPQTRRAASARTSRMASLLSPHVARSARESFAQRESVLQPQNTVDDAFQRPASEPVRGPPEGLRSSPSPPAVLQGTIRRDCASDRIRAKQSQRSTTVQDIVREESPALQLQTDRPLSASRPQSPEAARENDWESQREYRETRMSPRKGGWGYASPRGSTEIEAQAQRQRDRQRNQHKDKVRRSQGSRPELHTVLGDTVADYSFTWDMQNKDNEELHRLNDWARNRRQEHSTVVSSLLRADKGWGFYVKPTDGNPARPVSPTSASPAYIRRTTRPKTVVPAGPTRKSPIRSASPSKSRNSAQYKASLRTAPVALGQNNVPRQEVDEYRAMIEILNAELALQA